METTTFLAQFWGWLLVILGLIFLIRKRILVENLSRLIKDKSYLLFTGYISLIIGLVTVILHNVWVTDWRVVITIFGWISLLRGVARISFPEAVQKFVPVSKNKLLLIQTLLIVTIILGGWLIWMSY